MNIEHLLTFSIIKRRNPQTQEDEYIIQPPVELPKELSPSQSETSEGDIMNETKITFIDYLTRFHPGIPPHIRTLMVKRIMEHPKPKISVRDVVVPPKQTNMASGYKGKVIVDEANVRKFVESQLGMESLWKHLS